jgi:hypothetical protein
MSEKTSAELIVDELKENKSQIVNLAEKTAEEIKSVGDKIALGLKEGFEGQAKEEVKSLKDQLANKDEELKSLRSGQGVSSHNAEVETKSVRELASKLRAKEVISLESEELKAIRFSDATTTGTFNDSSARMGVIDVNKQPLVTILEDIGVMPAINANDGSLAWDGYDESLVDMFDANEMDAAQLSEAVKKSLIKLNMREVKAKMIISSRVVQNVAAGGDQVAILNSNIQALESRYRRKLASQVFKDIISGANLGAIGKVISTTADAPADATARQDLRLFPSNLKMQYEASSVLYVSRPFLNAIFSKEAADGHLATEQFRTSDNGITYFITGGGQAMPVRQFEFNQIGTYKSLVDGTTDITTDYVNGSDNTGKLLAIVGDLKYAYKLIPSTIGTIGYDSGISNILDGYCPAGKVSFAAQGVVAKEAIKVFYGR